MRRPWALRTAIVLAVVEVSFLSKTHVSIHEHVYESSIFLQGFVPEIIKHNKTKTTTGANDDEIDGMAACLLVRDDNSLLPEWIAHHYTILPLRDLLIAADFNSKEDVTWIYEQWSPLIRVTIWNHTHFIHRFGDIPSNETANHQYLHRQRAFITSCMEYFKRKNKTWVALVDTDEYISLNRDYYVHYNNNDYTRETHPTTVLQALERYPPTSPCHGMPRLLFGALENMTCNENEHVREFLFKHNIPPLTTVRFVQHAQKGVFYPSKWGKVLINVHDISWESLLHTKPKSSHRPLKECPKPLFDWNTSLLHVNHYLGSWERYSKRVDSRRSRKAFDERASLVHGNNCNTLMTEWIPTFFQQVGLEQAKQLLQQP